MLIQLDHVKKEYEDFTLELDMQIPENRVTRSDRCKWSR